MESKWNVDKNMPVATDQRRKVKYSWNNGNAFDKVLTLHTYFKVPWSLEMIPFRTFFVLSTNEVRTEGKTPNWVLIKEIKKKEQQKRDVKIVEMIPESSNHVVEMQAN